MHNKASLSLDGSLRSDGGPPPWRSCPFDPAERRLSDAMGSFWTSFVHDGDPGPEWPAAAGQDFLGLRLTVDSLEPVTTLYEHHRCDFWRDLFQ